MIEKDILEGVWLFGFPRGLWVGVGGGGEHGRRVSIVWGGVR